MCSLQDEPENDLDVETLRALENAISNFAGERVWRPPSKLTSNERCAFLQQWDFVYACLHRTFSMVV